MFVGSKIRRPLPIATFTHKFFLFIFCGAVAFLIYIPLALVPVVVPGPCMDPPGLSGPAVGPGPGPWLDLWTFGPLDRLTFGPVDLGSFGLTMA